MSPVSTRPAHLAAALCVLSASCTGDREPVVAPTRAPEAPVLKVDVEASDADAVMMVRTPSPWAARGERGGTTRQLDAAVLNPKGKELERKRHVEWSSTDTLVATVDSTGLVTAQDTGRVTIVVDHKKSADSVHILVIPVPVASVTVAGVDSVSVDDTTAFVATPRDSVGEPLIGRAVTWTADPVGIVTTSAEGATGEVVALAVGTATVSATSEGKVGTKALRVWPQPVATVTVTPGEASVPMFRSVTLIATPRDRRGKLLTDRAVTWRSAAEGVVTVAAGKVTTVDMGQAVIEAESEGKVGRATVTVSNPVEARALWVTRFDYTGTVPSGPAKIAQIMQKAASANFNIVYFQVRTAGDALYTPRPGDPLEPCSPRLCSSLGSTLTPPYDPLAVAITEAARYGIEVHAWLNAYTGWIAGSATACNQLTPAPPAPPPQPTHMVTAHPEWLVVNSAGAKQPCLTTAEYVWVSPGIPAVRTRLAEVAADIARRYPQVKGIHLDRIRYPGTTWSYDAPSVDAFRAVYGVAPTAGNPAWADFRRAFVNAGVREVFDSIRAVNPSLVLSAAVFPGYQPIPGWAAQWSYRDLFQDPSAWALGGYLDVNVSMSYPATAASPSWTVKIPRPSACTGSESNVDWVCALDEHRSRIEQTAQRHVYVGVGAIKGWAEVERQLAIGHEKLVTGFSVFDFTKVDAIMANGMNGWQLLASGPFKHRAIVPGMPWKGGAAVSP